MRKRFFLNCLLILVLVAVMSTSAFAISESDVESAVSASGKEAVSGNVLVWFLCAIAFLKVSQKIDSFLSSLGLNVGHTGGSMLSEAMIAMRAINNRDQRGRQRIGQPQPSRFCSCIRKIRGRKRSGGRLFQRRTRRYGKPQNCKRRRTHGNDGEKHRPAAAGRSDCQPDARKQRHPFRFAVCFRAAAAEHQPA